jgi:ATP-binding cassette subfamily F protein 3
VVFVSHDRYFIDKLATRIFEVGDGEVKVFPGNYEDYLWRKQGGHVDLSLSLNGHHEAEPEASESSSALKTAKRVNPMKLKKLESRRKQLEEGIAQSESEIAGYEVSLQEFVSVDETLRVGRLLDEKRISLVALMTEWEEVSQALEAMA